VGRQPVPEPGNLRLRPFVIQVHWATDELTLVQQAGRARPTRLGRLAAMILLDYGSYRFENVHPLKCGIGRRLTLARSRELVTLL
jgi:hypothetical protein